MLTGEYWTTLDEKGRLSFPSKFREELGVEKLVITKAPDKCLWVFHPAKWGEVERSLTAATARSPLSLPFQEKQRRVRRMFISPAQLVEIDKTGRVAVPQNLREYAALEKDCVVSGQVDYFEIWDREAFAAYTSGETSENDFSAALEELGNALLDC